MDDLRNGQAYSPPGRLDWPADVERLPNGNTLITDAGYWSGQGSEILEVDVLGNIVWKYDKDLRFAHSAKLLPNGNIYEFWKRKDGTVRYVQCKLRSQNPDV